MPSAKSGLNRRQFNKMALGALGMALLIRPKLAWAARAKKPGTDVLIKTIKKQLAFYTRSAWSRQSPIYTKLSLADSFHRITIHHEGNKAKFNRTKASVIQDLRLDQAVHLRRGFGDIAYHFIIDYSGKVWEGRPLKYQGAHVAGNNTGNIGIMLLGNFEKQNPSQAQKDSLVKLVRIVRKHYNIGHRHVHGHRDLNATLCPGRNLYAFMPSVKTFFA